MHVAQSLLAGLSLFIDQSWARLERARVRRKESGAVSALSLICSGTIPIVLALVFATGAAAAPGL